MKMTRQFIKNRNATKDGGRHSSVVLSAPTILRPLVRISGAPSMLLSICINVIGIRPVENLNSKLMHTVETKKLVATRTVQLKERVNKFLYLLLLKCSMSQSL